jgi:hypothetical protein
MSFVHILLKTRVFYGELQFLFRWSVVWVPVGAANFSLYHRVQTGFGARRAPYLMGARGSTLEVEWPGHEADYPPQSSAEVKEWVELYFHSPNTPSWRGAQFKKHKDNFTVYFLSYKYLARWHLKCV